MHTQLIKLSSQSVHQHRSESHQRFIAYSLPHVLQHMRHSVHQHRPESHQRFSKHLAQNVLQHIKRSVHQHRQKSHQRLLIDPSPHVTHEVRSRVSSMSTHAILNRLWFHYHCHQLWHLTLEELGDRGSFLQKLGIFLTKAIIFEIALLNLGLYQLEYDSINMLTLESRQNWIGSLQS